MPVRTVYLDYNATTPLDPGVRAAMLEVLDGAWGNPSSVHRIGRHARAILDDARDRLARVCGCRPSELVFTSGGTEASNLAIFGVARLLRPTRRHLITSAIEHPAVLQACEYLGNKEGFALTVLPVDATGLVDPEDVSRALRSDTALVSIMAANNEIGTLQSVAEIGRRCREAGVLFHTDAVQWFGKQPFSGIGMFGADLVSICAHKFHGPKGGGALYIRSPLHPDPILFGGAHEQERRSGTENLASIAGLVSAFEKFVPTPVFNGFLLDPLVAELRGCLRSLASDGVTLRGAESGGLVNTVACTVSGTDSLTLLAALDLEGVCASSGSACAAGSLLPSHVILALGAPAAEAASLLRFSAGRETTEEDIRTVCRVLPGVVRRARSLSH